MLALGIDLSARRGLDLALLDGREVIALAHCAGVAETLLWIEGLRTLPRAIGIDAPQSYRLPLLCDPAFRTRIVPPPPEGRYQRYRVCDYHLARRGIGLYLTPSAGEPVPEWMAVGFTLFNALRERGFHLPAHADDAGATLLEVYPFAAFVTLLGAVPPSKALPAGLAVRRALLEQQLLVPLPAQATHDQLDALAAAYSAARFVEGNGCAPGDPREGLIALPVREDALLERYRRLPAI